MGKQVDFTFYRIVRSNPPTERDFWSHKQLGIPLLDPSNERLWEGVSAFDSLAQARKKARRFPDKGDFIAVLRITPDSGIAFAQTGRKREGHHTLWADPQPLLAAVVDIVPVAENGEP